MINFMEREHTQSSLGVDKWNTLSPINCCTHELVEHKMTLITLGIHEYNKLSDTDKKDTLFFIWTGCGIHKEINVLKYAIREVVVEWNTKIAVGGISKQYTLKPSVRILIIKH